MFFDNNDQFSLITSETFAIDYPALLLELVFLYGVFPPNAWIQFSSKQNSCFSVGFVAKKAAVTADDCRPVIGRSPSSTKACFQHGCALCYCKWSQFCPPGSLRCCPIILNEIANPRKQEKNGAVQPQMVALSFLHSKISMISEGLTVLQLYNASEQKYFLVFAAVSLVYQVLFSCCT